MSIQAPNLEEAANIAQEFIYSLDNLPNEVNHILQEIQRRDTRTQELQQEIDNDTSKYIRNGRKGLPTAETSTSAPSSRAPSRAPSPKLASLPAKIAAAYAEIQELSSEKCTLAERLIETISRTRVRLDHDLVKVRVLQGESLESMPVLSRPSVPFASGNGATFGAPGHNAALALSESVRNALASIPSLENRSVSTPSTPVATATSANGTTTKKRRVTATASSIKISPASPVKNRSASPSGASVASQVPHQKSRLSRQVITTAEDYDMDADGEEDFEGEDEGDDGRIYCFCQKTSYGDMIACDNEGGCPYEWFHLTCVGLKLPTPEKWYCSACSKEKGIAPATTTSRKGRKK